MTAVVLKHKLVCVISVSLSLRYFKNPMDKPWPIKCQQTGNECRPLHVCVLWIPAIVIWRIVNAVYFWCCRTGLKSGPLEHPHCSCHWLEARRTFLSLTLQGFRLAQLHYSDLGQTLFWMELDRSVQNHTWNLGDPCKVTTQYCLPTALQHAAPLTLAAALQRRVSLQSCG